MRNIHKELALGTLIVVSLLFTILIYKSSNPMNSISFFNQTNLPETRIRDFLFFQCNKVRRIGGKPGFVKNAPDELYRIDGAWYVCFDNKFELKKADCNILSFGINRDYSFDQDLRQVYNCTVHSFDPFIEADIFKKVRESDQSLKESLVLKVDRKWTFYKIGIKGYVSGQADFKNLNEILEMTKLKNKVVDIFKMDIEGAEKDIFPSMDMEYMCKYVKQLVFETHANFKFKDLVHLEKCFRLFWRDTRFFKGDSNGPTGVLTEFQNPNGWNLNIKYFRNELDLAEFMFVTGELYFLNSNFL